MDYMNLAREKQLDIIEMRRHLHENPELSQQEENTVKYIAEKLQEYGVEYKVVPKGGVLGFIGGKAEDQAKKTVLLRADIDALPVEEDPYNLVGPKKCVSKIMGVSHACGHDTHTAMLLAAAHILKEQEEKLPGRVILFFERAEEAGGNILYLLRYLYNNKIRIDGCYGTHVRGNIEAGKVSIESGAINAGGFGFEATIYGSGGHGARPSEANSPIDCFVALYQALSLIPVKYVPANQALSFSLGKVEAGSKRNIIPSKLDFAGSFRFFDHKVGIKAKQEFLRLCNSICKTYHCTFELTKEIGPTLPLVNEEHCTAIGIRALEETIGLQNQVHKEPDMGSESFSAALHMWPGVYSHLGIQNAALGSGAPNHSPKFDIDENALMIGTAMHIAFSFAFLQDTEKIPFTGYEGSPDDLYKEICYKVD